MGTNKYQDKYFETHFYMFKYDGIIRDILLNYKFKEQTYLYRSFMIFFNKKYKKFSHFDFYDIIIPVPISKKRMKTRGYNQSLLIAKEISKITNIKMEDNILIKQKNNTKQSTLNKIYREQNVIDAYKLLEKGKIENKNILLIDDIYTTGATVNECSKMLKLAGARKIDVFTIAKD